MPQPSTSNNSSGQESQSEDPYEPLYLEGIDYFNECEFFEAHETWEALWTEYRGPLREFYKGLIQAAVALHHFGNGNLHGARKVYGTSSGYLNKYRPKCRGLDLEAFLNQYQRCFEQVLNDDPPDPLIEIDPELIPEIHLQPPPTS